MIDISQETVIRVKNIFGGRGCGLGTLQNLRELRRSAVVES